MNYILYLPPHFGGVIYVNKMHSGGDADVQSVNAVIRKAFASFDHYCKYMQCGQKESEDIMKKRLFSFRIS